jgi:antitoxin VapB
MATPPIRQHVTCPELPGYMPLVYTLKIMAKTKVAKLFRNGRSQAVRLPKEFRFEGDSVRVRKVPGGVLLEPIISDAAKWLAELRRLNIEPLLPKGRKQPRAPRRRIFD